MKVVIAPDKFKGSLTAVEVCEAIKKGVLAVHPEAQISTIPLADGGEGTLDVLEKSLHLRWVKVTVHDPLFRPVQSSYCIKGEDAYVEMAKASGFELLADHERSACKTSSIGTGELIRDAIAHGARNIFLFVGGSATNDGGIGMATALGFRFLGEKDQEILPIGMNLSSIRSIDTDGFTDNVKINLITDVRNSLLGPTGASHQYGPQKGATQDEILNLDSGMSHLSNLIQAQFGKDISKVPGSGAAGGMGLSVLGLMNGSIQNGIETISDIVNFEEKLRAADLVITGEGKMDEQTLQGKVVHGVAKFANKFGIPAYTICGVNELQPDQIEQLGIKDIASVKTDELTVDFCMKNASSLIVERVKEMMGLLRSFSAMDMEKKKEIGIGIDIGGGHITAGAVDLEKATLLPNTVFHQDLNSKGTAQEILNSWSEIINQTLDSVGDNMNIHGLGIAMPGAFNYKRGIALFSDTDKYNALYDLDVDRALRPLLYVQNLPIRFINDATAFAIGTSWIGEAKGFCQSLVITLGTGFGSAIIKDGKPLVQGKNVPEHGCFWHLPFKEGIADDYFSTRWMVHRFNVLTGMSVNGVKEIYNQYEKNKHSQQVFNEFGEMLAEFLCPWLAGLKIEIMVIGGNISRALHCFDGPLRAYLKDRGVDLVIRKSELRETAALVGASRILMDEFWKSVKDDLPEK